MTSTRQKLKQQRQELVERIQHAELLATHTPTTEVLAQVRDLRTQLGRLDDVRTAWAHGKVSVPQSWQPSDSFFITRQELNARRGLAADRRVSYLN